MDSVPVMLVFMEKTVQSFLAPIVACTGGAALMASVCVRKALLVRTAES